ncbi:MAG: hypothetical protein AAFQ94_30525 [Bacteroidota bacterium]
MKTNNLLTSIRGVFAMLVAVAIFTACQPESENPIQEKQDEISEIVTELSAEEINALGLTPDEAKDAIFTQSNIEDIVGDPTIFSDARFSIAISSEYVTDLVGDTVGVSKLIRTPRGIIPIYITSGLVENTATTLWVITWGAPENCLDPAICRMGDIFNPTVQADALAGGGKVVRSSRIDIRASYVAAGDTEDSVNPFLLGVPAVGLVNPMTAEVALVIRTHGPVIPELLDSQLNTYNGGCRFDFLPPIPQLGEPGPNICQDIQFSRHRVN